MPATVVRPGRPEEAEAILAVWVAREIADAGHPQHDSSDAGVLLRAALEERARQHGMWVNDANAPALGLYESLGMRPVARNERWERELA